ncbi:MAG: hypothetical protein ABL908_17435 [Hyphomicrobium sp.]
MTPAISGALALAFILVSIRGLAKMGAFQGLLMFIILAALYLVVFPLGVVVNVVLFFMGLRQTAERVPA